MNSVRAELIVEMRNILIRIVFVIFNLTLVVNITNLFRIGSETFDIIKME
jgi:hypothetical protein